MSDNAEFRVTEVVKREPITYGKDKKTLPSSGATYYRLNTSKLITVKHTTAGTWVCLTCLVYYDGTAKGKGCEHTRVAMRYAETHDHVL